MTTEHRRIGAVMTTARLRADARRNRGAVVAAAAEVFADVGPDAPLELVARAAGVGIATLYRRFPDRDALVRAVVVESVAVLVDSRAARHEEPTAWDALVRSMRYTPALKTVLRLTGSAPRAAQDALLADPVLHGTRDELVALLAEMVRDAQTAGDLRRDVGVDDVVHLMSSLAHAHSSDDPDADSRFVRAQAIVLDGLRHHDMPLPGHPSTGPIRPPRDPA